MTAYVSRAGRLCALTAGAAHSSFASAGVGLATGGHQVEPFEAGTVPGCTAVAVRALCQGREHERCRQWGSRDRRWATALSPAAVTQRLTAAAQSQSGAVSQAAVATTLFCCRRVSSWRAASRQGGDVTIRLPAPAKHARAAVVRAVAEIRDQLAQADQSGRPDDKDTTPSAATGQDDVSGVLCGIHANPSR